MLARVLTLSLALIVGQAAAADLPPEAAWLKAIPAEADLAVRFRGLGIVKADLAKMLTAMSPTLAEPAGPILDGLVAQVSGRFGEAAVEGPAIILVRAVPPDENGSPAFAVIVKSDDYEGVKKSIAGGRAVKAAAQPGGFEKFDGPDGKPMFSVKGAGYVAFGADQTLISGVARPAGKPLWSDALADSFLRGDMGVFINVAAIQKRYGAQIDAAKEQMAAGVEQAANAGGEAMKESVKGIVNKTFDALKVADSVAMFFDFEPYGLVVAGTATVLPGTEAAASLAKAMPAQGTLLETLPGEGTFFMDLSSSAETTVKLQKFGYSMLMGPATEESPEVKKALDLIRQAGITEMATASFGTTSNISVALASDPAKAVEGTTAMLKALSTSKGMPEYIKSVKVSPASTYQGFALNESETAIDLEKFAKLQPNSPNGAEAAKKMFGGDKIHAWFGTDGRRFLTVTAPTWAAAKSHIDAVVSGVGTLGKFPNYATLREQMPGKTNFLMMGSAQGLVRQLASQMTATLPGGVELKPGEMPREIAVFGASVTAYPNGYQFEFRLPSANGPVFEKGLMPILQGLQGKVGM